MMQIIMEMAIIDKTSKGSIITNYAVTQLPFWRQKNSKLNMIS